MHNYDRNIILMAYRAAHPSDLQPSSAVLRQFDQALHDRYDDELRLQAQEEGIGNDRLSLSLLVFFASQSGASTVKARVARGCRYFLAVEPTVP